MDLATCLCFHVYEKEPLTEFSVSGLNTYDRTLKRSTSFPEHFSTKLNISKTKLGIHNKQTKSSFYPTIN